MFTLWSWGSIRSGVFAQWCIYTLVCLCAFVCVRVKGHCVGGHQFCEWCCFEAGWDRISRKGQREKSPLTKSKHFPHNSMSSPAGPQYRPTHAHTLTFPTTTHIHIDLSPWLFRCGVDKPEEAGELKMWGVCLIQMEVLMSHLWPLPLSLSEVRVHLNMQPHQMSFRIWMSTKNPVLLVTLMLLDCLLLFSDWFQFLRIWNR